MSQVPEVRRHGAGQPSAPGPFAASPLQSAHGAVSPDGRVQSGRNPLGIGVEESARGVHVFKAPSTAGSRQPRDA